MVERLVAIHGLEAAHSNIRGDILPSTVKDQAPDAATIAAERSAWKSFRAPADFVFGKSNFLSFCDLHKGTFAGHDIYTRI